MHCYESEARLLFARERATFLAGEMRKAQAAANARRSGSAQAGSGAHGVWGRYLPKRSATTPPSTEPA
jgi:hypothetical protein